MDGCLKDRWGGKIIEDLETGTETGDVFPTTDLGNPYDFFLKHFFDEEQQFFSLKTYSIYIYIHFFFFENKSTFHMESHFGAAVGHPRVFRLPAEAWGFKPV